MVKEALMGKDTYKNCALKSFRVNAYIGLKHKPEDTSTLSIEQLIPAATDLGYHHISSTFCKVCAAKFTGDILDGQRLVKEIMVWS